MGDLVLEKLEVLLSKEESISNSEICLGKQDKEQLVILLNRISNYYDNNIAIVLRRFAVVCMIYVFIPRKIIVDMLNILKLIYKEKCKKDASADIECACFTLCKILDEKGKGVFFCADTRDTLVPLLNHISKPHIGRDGVLINRFVNLCESSRYLRRELVCEFRNFLIAKDIQMPEEIREIVGDYVSLNREGVEILNSVLNER